MSHFIQKCECGTIIAQCRCMGEKSVEIVGPCTHFFTTATLSSIEPISMDALTETYNRFMQMFPYIPNVFKCHPSVYNSLREYFDKQEADMLGEGVTRPTLPYADFMERIMGVTVVIDPEMNHGEWKFEDIHKQARRTYG